MNIYVFLGPPGVGKGSLSRLCVDTLGWVQLSTGNLCRSHIAKQTDIGKKIDFTIKSGKLIPDSLITDMVKQWFTDNCSLNSTVILDGYPRTVAQAIAIRDMFENNLSTYKLNVVKLVIPEEVVITRLSSRLICGNNECQAVYSAVTQSLVPRNLNSCDKCSSVLIRRQDDEEKYIRERLSIYNQHEGDLLKYYSQLGQRVLSLNVEKQLEDVFAEFKRLIS